MATPGGATPGGGNGAVEITAQQLWNETAPHLNDDVKEALERVTDKLDDLHLYGRMAMEFRINSLEGLVYLSLSIFSPNSVVSVFSVFFGLSILLLFHNLFMQNFCLIFFSVL